jgi:DNA-binding CsgD family transcriptional regulator
METKVFGREAEMAEIEAMLGETRRGFAAIVLEGAPGIGKTTVWRIGVEHAARTGCLILSCRAAPAEARLSFAALGDLLAPVELSTFEALPNPQRRALDAALLRTDHGGSAPNPRTIGTGLVTLLSALSAERPVVIAMDDLQWVDLPSSRALEFALRRLVRHPVAVLATRRVGAEGFGTLLDVGERVRALRLGPLGLIALHSMIQDRFDRRLPRPLLARIDRVCGGNPFFALEIVRALEPLGIEAARRELPLPDDLHRLVAARLRNLPAQTRDALLRASALAQPTLATVQAGDLAPAEEAGVVHVGTDGRIVFAHPLFATGIHAAASAERRRRVHAELADIVTDVEERARHLLLARSRGGEDDHLARILHDAAEHAVRRGAPEVGAELEEEAARLTPAEQTDLRHRRSLRAARLHLKAGDSGHARVLCEAVLSAAPPAPLRAEALQLMAATRVSERPEDSLPLLEEALACSGDDDTRSAELEIAIATLHVVLFDFTAARPRLDRAVELAERSGSDELLAEAIATRAYGRFMAGDAFDDAALEKALALEDLDREAALQIRPSMSVGQLYQFVGRPDLARIHFTRLREHLEARGDEGDLPWVLVHLAAVSCLAGDLGRSEREASEAERAAAVSGLELFRAFALMVRAVARALRGDEAGARSDAEETLQLSECLGRWPHAAADARWALGLLALARGEAGAAVAAFGPVIAGIEAVGVYDWPVAHALPDAIEALVAAGEVEHAGRLAQALADYGERRDRPWALAMSSRALALLAAAAGDYDHARAAVERALAAHERLTLPFELARTLLIKGQIQRRRGERREARATLECAVALLRDIGAPRWADRAAAEMSRIGVRRAPEDLTEGERRAAELAAQGFTNREIGERLFISRRTVEANLARAYRKLGIRSRAELGISLTRRSFRR